VRRAESGRLRIIGGRWRGRRLPVPEQPGLRPTTDRVRETLFNWLAPRVEGARVLDCFAGSGALGLEAASRGAAAVVLIERSPLAARGLRENLAALGADQVVVHCADTLDWLAQSSPTPFDLCFLDPPFTGGLLLPTLDRLVAHGWLADGAWLYVETDRRAPALELPEAWHWRREKQAGQVRYGLLEVGSTGSPAR
jgi:16S rRNA (guanine966-N2)-methyltransferase